MAAMTSIAVYQQDMLMGTDDMSVSPHRLSIVVQLLTSRRTSKSCCAALKRRLA